MKNLNQIILIGALMGVLCFASQAKEIVSNGDFKQLINRPTKYANIVKGEKFVNRWSIVGSGEIKTKEGEGNKLILYKGMIYSFLAHSWRSQSIELEGKITVSGVGKVKLQLSTCVKKEAKQPFSHAKRSTVGEFELSEKTKTFKFKYTMEAGEIGYIYIYAQNGPITISRISVKTKKIKNPETQKTNAILTQKASSALVKKDKKGLPKVYLIGDSLRLQYQKDVGRLLTGEAEVSGPKKNSCYTDYILNRMDKWLEGKTLDVIHINVGLHDVWLLKKTGKIRNTPETYAENLQEILEKLKKTNATVIFALTTPVDEKRMATSFYKRVARRNSDIEIINNIARKVAAKCNVKVNDLNTAIKKGGIDKMLLKDGTHLTREGRAVLSKQIAESIRNAIKSRKKNQSKAYKNN